MRPFARDLVAPGGELHVGPLRVARWGEGAAAGVGAGACDAVAVCMPKALAGMGTSRQLQGVVAGLAELLADRPVSFGYVGPRADPEYGEHLASPLAEISPAETVAGTYAQAQAAFEAALGHFGAEGRRRAVILCMGYTAFGPEAVKRAKRALEAAGEPCPEHALVFLVDSTYPDTDEEERELDAGGWPTGRFYAPAFASEGGVDVAFLVTSAYDYDVHLLNERAPRGMVGATVVCPPYTDEYVAQLRADSARGCEDGLGPLLDVLPGMKALGERDLVAPIVSSDIWSDEHVGVWMTRSEHVSCVVGTEAIVLALRLVARQRSQRIWVPVDTACADFVSGLELLQIQALRPGEEPREDALVVLSPYRGIPQEQHSRMLGAADVAISRTGGQANASVVLALARTPNVVVDMPACGYMQSELTSLAVTHDARVTPTPEGRVALTEKEQPLAWRGRWYWPPERLAELISDAIGKPWDRERRINAARDAFERLRGSETGNVLAIVRRLTGS